MLLLVAPVVLGFRFLRKNENARRMSLETDILVQPKMSLGERMKTFEKEEYISPQSAWMLRMDGKTFSSFTSKFKKPFDERFTRAMVRTLNQLMEHFNPSCGFCCSDEITLVFPPNYGKMTEHYFNGRKNKISTLSAGKCSAYFLLNIIAEMHDDKKMIEYIIKQAPCFDSRLMEIPQDKLYEVCNNLRWRSLYDCRRNTISTYGRYILGTKVTQNKNGEEMIKMMKEKDFDFDMLETYKVYGVYAKKKEMPYTNEHGSFKRNEIFNFECVITASPEMTKFVLDHKSISQEEFEKITKDLMIQEINDVFV